jgi:hypothetical protein
VKKFFGILVLLSLISCSSSEVVKNYNSGNPVFTIKATSCYGKCPEYEIEIHGDGKVFYTGKKNVEKLGSHEFKISEKEIDELLKEFENAKFWDMKDEYTAKVTDLPTIYISCSYNGKVKKITDYYGAPAELKMLEEKLGKYRNMK